MIPNRFRALVVGGAIFALCSFAAGAASSPAAAPAKETGDLWEVTTQMSMEGMPMAMPTRSQRTCAPREWKEPPGAKDQQKDCRTTDFKTTATKTSWKMTCAGPPAMSGEGEITRSSPDAYTGTLKFTSSDGTMTMKLNGRRVGDCDAGEAKKQVADLVASAEKSQADAAAMQAEICKSLVTSMNLQALNQSTEMCKDPGLKPAFCARLETEQGYDLVATCGNKQGDGMDDEAAYCGKSPEDITKKLCTDALRNESLDFLARCCPVEGQALAQKECSERAYTGMAATKYTSFCVAYARQALNGTQAGQDAAKPESKMEKAKKSLKGLWKH